ncbi:hypothetical protein [Saccharopolyspora terrae]|uniref:hypothetical protein n=1 Tax=Saccharopolyspora terrae TaxID=2530384 RepID=UPI001F302118|nr:hypothetical protein [Saccharopolyspora terrae]
MRQAVQQIFKIELGRVSHYATDGQNRVSRRCDISARELRQSEALQLRCVLAWRQLSTLNHSTRIPHSPGKVF